MSNPNFPKFDENEFDEEEPLEKLQFLLSIVQKVESDEMKFALGDAYGNIWSEAELLRRDINLKIDQITIGEATIPEDEILKIEDSVNKFIEYVDNLKKTHE
jgi:hypothetical protein